MGKTRYREWLRKIKKDDIVGVRFSSHFVHEILFIMSTNLDENYDFSGSSDQVLEIDLSPGDFTDGIRAKDWKSVHIKINVEDIRWENENISWATSLVILVIGYLSENIKYMLRY